MPAPLWSSKGLRWAAAAVFVATRIWMLGLDTASRTDLLIYASYAHESLEARARGVPLYEHHRARTAARAAARPENPSLGAEWRYRIEYPPLAVTWIAAVAQARGLDPAERGFARKYLEAYRVAMALVDALVFAALVFGRAARRRADELAALAAYVVGVPVLGYLAYDRLDLALGAIVVAGLAAVLAERALPALLALALGTLFKLAPAFLGPLWLVALAPAAAWPAIVRSALPRALGWIALVGGALALYVLRDGAGALDFLRAQSGRDVEIGSVAATVLLALETLGAPVRTVYAQGSIGLATPWLGVLDPLLGLAQAAALLAIVLLFVRARRHQPGDAAKRRGDVALASLASLLLAILTAKLFSPQYLLWLLPALPLLVRSDAGSHRDALAFLAIAALTTWIWPIAFQEHVIGTVRVHGLVPELSGPTLLGAALLAVRNGLCVAWAVALVRRLVRRGAASAT